MSPLPPLADIRASQAPAVVILGNDALLAARPATPVQLAHACLAAGFRAVLPGSWGDELVADATLTALKTRTARPAIHCACPHVARRVLAVGSDLAPHLVSLVAPPVAAARYLRLHSSEDLRVTYVGRCPAAADDAIDARLTPEELLAQLVDRGIDLSTQPEVFDSMIPPDRRRHLSLPGGLPSTEMLWARTQCTVATMKSGEFAAQLADLVLASTDTLIDPAPLVGCACAGTIRGESSDPRGPVIALEPPRSATPVVEDSAALRLELALPAAARNAMDLVGDTAGASARGEQHTPDGPVQALGDAPPPPPIPPNRRPRLTPPGMAALPAPSSGPSGSSAPNSPPRRRSPLGTRVVAGSVPFGSDSEGRILPRAYVARRRSPRGGVPQVRDGGGDPVAPQPVVAVPSAPVSASAATPAAHRAPPSPSIPSVQQVESASPPPRRAEPIRQAPAPRAEDATRSRADSERTVTRTVEPGSVRPAATSATVQVVGEPPVAVVAVPDVRHGPRVTSDVGTAAWARLGTTSAALRRNPRVVIAAAVAAAGLLLGVAIGYSAGRRGAEPAHATATPVERGGDPLADPTQARPLGARESVSSGGIAPARGGAVRQTPRAPSRSTTAAAGRPGARALAGSNVRRGGADSAAAPAPSAPIPAAVSAPAALPDTASVRARRDSAARVDALNAEREAIRREIGTRRARVDSIERARLHLDSLRRVEQAGTRPPRR